MQGVPRTKKNMVRVVNIEENTLHKVSEVICIECKHRWIAVRPTTTLLKNLECARCGLQGYVIETGEIMEE